MDRNCFFLTTFSMFSPKHAAPGLQTAGMPHPTIPPSGVGSIQDVLDLGRWSVGNGMESMAMQQEPIDWRYLREYPHRIWPNKHGTFTYLHQLDPEDLPLMERSFNGRLLAIPKASILGKSRKIVSRPNWFHLSFKGLHLIKSHTTPPSNPIWLMLINLYIISSYPW